MTALAWFFLSTTLMVGGVALFLWLRLREWRRQAYSFRDGFFEAFADLVTTRHAGEFAVRQLTADTNTKPATYGKTYGNEPKHLEVGRRDG